MAGHTKHAQAETSNKIDDKSWNTVWEMAYTTTFYAGTAIYEGNVTELFLYCQNTFDVIAK